MDFLYVADESKVARLAASMVSLMDSCKRDKSLTIHVMDMGITSESREKLWQLAVRRRKSIAFYVPGADFSAEDRQAGEHGLMHVCLDQVLSAAVERVICLDSDTLVMDDLLPLWETDMGENPVGMVQDATVRKTHRQSCGLPDALPYFSAGVMLVDRPLWRRMSMAQRAFSFHDAKKDRTLLPDQDDLNGAWAGQIHPLHPRYGVDAAQLHYTGRALAKICRPTPCMDEKQYQASVQHPAIVRFSGMLLPWRAGNKHIYEGAFMRYMAFTPWGSPPQEAGWRMAFRLYRLMHRLLKPFPVLRWKLEGWLWEK